MRFHHEVLRETRELTGALNWRIRIESSKAFKPNVRIILVKNPNTRPGVSQTDARAAGRKANGRMGRASSTHARLIPTWRNAPTLHHSASPDSRTACPTEPALYVIHRSKSASQARRAPQPGVGEVGRTTTRTRTKRMVRLGASLKGRSGSAWAPAEWSPGGY
jgi:hypothetical protein